MIGLGILFFTGHWWPGILILIGISAVLGAVWRESNAPTLPQNEWERPETPPAAPAPQPVVTPPPAPAAPVNSAPRVDLLPSTCPRCGAPVRSNEIKWTSTHSATCTYCGSNLMTGNQKTA
jgi:DNA-directed RNA polymerase subunit RPC12/RpoP